MFYGYCYDFVAELSILWLAAYHVPLKKGAHSNMTLRFDQLPSSNLISNELLLSQTQIVWFI